jgi:predicted MFS family arabinose efflux permease
VISLLSNRDDIPLSFIGHYMRSILRLLSMPSDLHAKEKKILLLLGAAYLIGAYDMTLVTLALPDIQASFSIAEEELGNLIAYARLGAIPAVLLALVADRIGRRKLLVMTLIGLSLFSLATAFAQSAMQFIILQSAAKFFITLEEVLAVIFALEVLPARHRGWGVGFLAAMGGLGAGLGAMLYSTVEYLPGGWRALYVMGSFAILYIAFLRRNLPESPMFEKQSHNIKSSLWQPLLEIFTQHRRALLALAVISATFWFQIGANLNFMSKYLQSSHGYSPGEVSMLFVVAGAFAIFGNVVAGKVSDTIGRRPTLVFGIVANCAAFLAFYNSSSLLLPLAWIAALFSFFIVDVVVTAATGELFPTSCRSTAASLRVVVAVLAGAVGLAAEGVLYSHFGSHATALSLLTLSSLLGLPAVALWLRETANTELS